MCFSSPKAPAPPPKVPEAPQTPTQMQDMYGSDSADTRRKRLLSGRSSKSTILTGSRGIMSEAPTTSTTLLGS